MPDISEPNPPRSRFGRSRRPSMVPREVVLGLDRVEWGISLFGAGIAFALALVTGLEWIRNTPTILTQKPAATGPKCLAGYHLVTELCEKVEKTTRSSWEVKFLFIFLIALCLLYFTLRRKRAGVACFAIFLGLGLGIDSGLVFFFLGAWLLVRAYRLQRYGVATFLKSNQVAREMGEAKRAGRAYVKRVDPESASSSTPAAPRTPPPPSKRYTPKKPPRRR